MIVGNRDRFAIEAEVEQRVDGWILGRFRFWLAGHPVGNGEDVADLKGCVRWLRDFAENPRDRFDARLLNLDPPRVFELIYDPVVGPGGIANPEEQPIPDSYSRFHISRLGMSSFDRFDVLLVKDEHGAERCLWREAGNNEIMECRLWRNEMGSVAAEFCERFEKDVVGIENRI
jgi:hypothetical protein